MEPAVPFNGTLTIDQNRDNVFVVPMTAAVISVAFTNNAAKEGQRVELHFVQDSTGGHTLTGLPTGVELFSAFTLSTGANAHDVLTLRQMTDASDPGGVTYAEIARTMSVAGVTSRDLGDVTGLSSAQIDAKFTATPADGTAATALASANPVLLFRRNGKWNQSAAYTPIA